MKYGYIRVSTREQNEQRQLIALRAFGIEEERIFMDKQSGKDFARKGYRRLIRKLKNGDTLVVKSIDRLGRNYEEILEQWRLITKEKRAAIVVLDMPLLDTRQNRDLTGTLIADIVLQLLSYVAQTERKFIRQRQVEGIAAAKAKEVKFGRRQGKQPAAFAPWKQKWMDLEIFCLRRPKAAGDRTQYLPAVGKGRSGAKIPAETSCRIVRCCLQLTIDPKGKEVAPLK